MPGGFNKPEYDLIVVGAGLTGSEAALKTARAGLNVLLVTTSLDTVYNLTGAAAELTPPAGTLLAERGTQTQVLETFDLHRRAKGALEREPKLHLLQSSVMGLLTENRRVTGVSTWEGVDRTGYAGRTLRRQLFTGAAEGWNTDRNRRAALGNGLRRPLR